MKLTVILTKREWSILSMIATGNALKETANKLHISERTVVNHVQNIKEKACCQKNTELTMLWFCLQFNIPLKEVKRRAIATFFLIIMAFQILSSTQILIRPRLRRDTREETRSRRYEDEMDGDILIY